MKKKISILCLVLVLLFSCVTMLVACNGNNNPDGTDDDDTPKTLQEKYDDFLAQTETLTKFELTLEVSAVVKGVTSKQVMTISVADKYISMSASVTAGGQTTEVYQSYAIYENNYTVEFDIENNSVSNYGVAYDKEPSNTIKYSTNIFLTDMAELPKNFLLLVDSQAQFGETQATFSSIDKARDGVLTIDENGVVTLTFKSTFQNVDSDIKYMVTKMGTNTTTVPDYVNEKYQQITTKEFDFAKIDYARQEGSGKVVVEYKDAQNQVINTKTALLNNGSMYMFDSENDNDTAVLEKDGYYLYVTKRKFMNDEVYNYTYQLSYKKNIDFVLDETLNISSNGDDLIKNFEYDQSSKKYIATETALKDYYTGCKSVAIDISVNGQYTLEIETIEGSYGNAKYITAVISNVGEAQTLNVPEDMTRYTQQFINGMLFEVNGENTVKLTGIVFDKNNVTIPNQVTIGDKTYTVTEIEVNSYISQGTMVNRTLTIPASVTTYKPFAQKELKEIHFEDIAHQWTVNGASEPLFVTDAVRNVQYAKQYTDVWTKVVE